MTLTPTTDYLAAIEHELRKVTHPEQSHYSEFFNMFHYHLGWTDAAGNALSGDTGKRLRPLLCLWCAEAAGADWRDALPAAAAVELVHNFSLIHDDIEDNSAARRGRPAVWQQWGLAQGVNAGDAMFVLAQIALDSLSARVHLDTLVEIRSLFNRAALGLTRGQYLDLRYESADQVDITAYFEMVRGKTAALVRGAASIGARIGTGDASRIDAFGRFGEHLGIAFQIADDILGIWGDPEITGKSAHTDLTSRKKSYPILAALESDMQGELRDLYQQAELSTADLQRIYAILSQLGAREIAEHEANQYAQHALEALSETRIDNPQTDRLRDLVWIVIGRDK